MSNPVYGTAAHRRASRAIRGMPCAWCGRPSSQLDHIAALVDGGSAFDPRNLAPSCASCNARRGLEVAMRRARGLGDRSRRW